MFNALFDTGRGKGELTNGQRHRPDGRCEEKKSESGPGFKSPRFIYLYQS
jgi:hypothetical protein